MVFINGQFPGPTLSIDEGDDVEFAVTNQLPFGTTIHFHGIEYVQLLSYSNVLVNNLQTT